MRYLVSYDYCNHIIAIDLPDYLHLFLFSYRELYKKCKGNVFKNKRVLMEHIHLAKDEKKRQQILTEEATARRNKLRAKKEKAAAKLLL
jgi:hypothetical protein